MFQVQVGNLHTVEWRLGTRYEDLTLSEGTGLVFHWSGSYHNLLEMSAPVESDCKYVNKDSFQLGQVWGRCARMEYYYDWYCRSVLIG